MCVHQYCESVHCVEHLCLTWGILNKQSGQRSHPGIDPWMCLSCTSAYTQNKVGGGEGLVGIYGSMTQAGTRAIMAAMAENACMGPDSVLVDIGAGLGRCGHLDLLLAQRGTLHTPLLLSACVFQHSHVLRGHHVAGLCCMQCWSKV